MWMTAGLVLAIGAPTLIGSVEYFVERGMNIVISPREWVPNPTWPKAGPQYLHGEKLVDFVPRMQQYTKAAEIIITLSSASLVFIPSHLTKTPALAFPLILLGFTVLWGVCFVAWMSYCYETALYNPENFGAKSSSLMFGLGFGALSCFAAAYLAISIIAAHQLPG